ncbi:uncharacterized protein PADG_02662 [Paracoccidioides brasiliensis Pb18]|uniref:Uncharacterized protein n=1 Tax=Paracoccidioides brasiliensis (strain Pb18) TaxID=502780 RepID=C1G657_PARBD|nr:uncharacterized protein PADG_02662 [Paracoccidioides brasiliensis Pb18]EEH46564.2 hypothetical protein PADG_02662 [Paracoccidioides brasiliensis Pb18]
MVWKRINDNSSFRTGKLFPSKRQLEYVCRFIKPITSEWELRYCERHWKIKFAPYLPESLKMRVSERKNLLSEEVRQMSADRVTETRSSAKVKRQKSEEKGAYSSYRSCQADRFCVYQQEGNEYISVIVIEYKAPHKLRQAGMTTGLAKEIRPAPDVICQDSDDTGFLL